MQRLPRDQLSGVDLRPHAPLMDWSIARALGEDGDVYLADAERWLLHQASFFSLEDVSLGDRIDWHRDYASGNRGPMKYSALIDHRRGSTIGDVKYVWELNRLQQLVLLGLAFRQTANTAYRDEIIAQTLSWISSNPFMMGINWKSALEAALRLISWAYVTWLVGDQFPADFYDKLRTSIYQHQYFIAKFYSKHSSANNHLVGEMAGLYVASVIWPFYPESNSWRSMARQTLVREISRQVHSDGVGSELSTEYQLFVLELFLMAAALGHAAADPFPEAFWQQINGMVTFLLAISDRNCNFPLFGDGDSGQVVAVPDTRQARARSLMRFCSGLSREANASPLHSDTRMTLLLWGQSPASLPFRPRPACHADFRPFPEGGYYVLTAEQGRENAMMIVLDAGELGLPPLCAHGHADALSFWLSYGGYEFLVDPGTFSYEDGRWRNYFRGTAAHNTIRIDGQDQSVANGRFQWLHTARCEVHHAEESDEWIEVEASHDGYKRLTDPVVHRRRLRLFKRSKDILIADRLVCAATHDVEIYFHFHENCSVRQRAICSFTAEIENFRLTMNMDPKLRYQVVRGSENPILGWVSRRYGVKTASMTIIGTGCLAGLQEIVTEISPA
jgi:uncharacterized heparinase superfamily protein